MPLTVTVKRLNLNFICGAYF